MACAAQYVKKSLVTSFITIFVATSTLPPTTIHVSEYVPEYTSSSPSIATSTSEYIPEYTPEYTSTLLSESTSTSISTSEYTPSSPSSLISTTTTSKRGIPFNNTATLSSFEDSPAISWCYNWCSTTDSESTGSLGFVPMLKEPEALYTDSWETDAQSAINAGSDYLTSYNEPDINGISPESGASVYKSYMSDMFPDQFLGAPALTNMDETFAWWQSFLESCQECKIDFWPIHWYDLVNNTAYFQDFVNKTAAFAAGTGKGTKIWVTEIGFRDDPTQSEMNNFLLENLPFLDNHPDVDRYAFTAVTDGGLDMLSEGQTGSLMETGDTYVSTNI